DCTGFATPYNRDCRNPPPSRLRPPAVNSSSKPLICISAHRLLPTAMNTAPFCWITSLNGQLHRPAAIFRPTMNRRSPRPGLLVPAYLTLRCPLAQPASLSALSRSQDSRRVFFRDGLAVCRKKVPGHPERTNNQGAVVKTRWDAGLGMAVPL